MLRNCCNLLDITTVIVIYIYSILIFVLFLFHNQSIHDSIIKENQICLDNYINEKSFTNTLKCTYINFLFLHINLLPSPVEYKPSCTIAYFNDIFNRRNPSCNPKYH